MTPEIQAPRPFAHHYGFKRHHGSHGVIAGLTVITFGTLLLARELGWLPEGVRVWDFWPILLIAFGLSHVRPGRSLVGITLSLIVALLGVGLLLENLGVIMLGVAHLWPIVIVVVGVGMLWRGFTHRGYHHVSSEALSVDELRRSVTMGGAQIKVESQDFKGGSLSAVMSGVEIDLRQAAMTQDEVTLDIDSVMSGIELRVPPTWSVVTHIAPVLGAVEDRTPPTPELAGPKKRLVLTGSVVLGAVEIQR